MNERTPLGLDPAAADHMARRVREASELAAQHVGMPVTLWENESGIDYSNHLTGIYMQAVRRSAWQLMWDASYLCAGTGYDFVGPEGHLQSDSFADAIRWLAEVAHEYGILDGENPSLFQGKLPPTEPNWAGEPPPQIEELLPAGQWPSTAHLRLHYLADIGNGWLCRDCGIGLIDVCRDGDTIRDASGRRIIRPGCGKRLPTRDHRIPQSLNGSDGPDNLDLVCRPCNSSKGAS
jgi:hypothetical protein